MLDKLIGSLPLVGRLWIEMKQEIEEDKRTSMEPSLLDRIRDEYDGVEDSEGEPENLYEARKIMFWWNVRDTARLALVNLAGMGATLWIIHLAFGSPGPAVLVGMMSILVCWMSWVETRRRAHSRTVSSMSGMLGASEVIIDALEKRLREKHGDEGLSDAEKRRLVKDHWEQRARDMGLAEDDPGAN